MPVKMLNPVHQSTQKKIVMYHNFFRSRVHPPAADMLAMVRARNGLYLLIIGNITPGRHGGVATYRQHLFPHLNDKPFLFYFYFYFLKKKKHFPRQGRSNEFV